MELVDPIPAEEPETILWWQEDIASCPPAPKCPLLAGRTDTPVAIVGCGFTGLWTALTLRIRAPGLHQVHHEGNRRPEMRRGRPARMTVLDKPDNAFTQIKRIGFWHRESPPSPEANHERRFSEIPLDSS